MISLSRSALVYAISICREKENYRVTVVCDSETGSEAVMEELCNFNLVRDPQHTHRVVKGRNSSYLQFKNGSIIRVIAARESVRGLRSHLIIVSPEVNKEIVECVLRPMETLKG